MKIRITLSSGREIITTDMSNADVQKGFEVFQDKDLRWVTVTETSEGPCQMAINGSQIAMIEVID